jgi:KRAB domain-containing zinc finger protein
VKMLTTGGNPTSGDSNDDTVQWNTCTKCDYKTLCLKNLKKHAAESHSKKKILECKDCSFQTTHRSSLCMHIQSRHTDQDKVKWKKCTKCDYRTLFRTNIKHHISAVHRNERNFKCEECAFKTALKGNLKKHVQNVHHTSKKADRSTTRQGKPKSASRNA